MFCPNCGKEYSEDQNFCRYCGINLKNKKEILNNPQREKEQTTLEDENKFTQEETEQAEPNSDYKTELITASSEGIPNKTNNEKQEQNVKQENETEEKIYAGEHYTNFREISENEEYKKYKQQLMQSRENLSEKQKSEKSQQETKAKQTKASAKMITGIGMLVTGIVIFGNLLWSIDVETQITPTEMNEGPQINLPTEEEERAYTQEPKRAEQEEAVETEEKQTEGLYAEREEISSEKKVNKTQIAKQEVKEASKEEKEIKVLSKTEEIPIPPMPKIQEPELNFEPTEAGETPNN